MEVLRFSKKGICMDTTEKVYIYRGRERGNQLNDKYTVSPNKIFEAVLRRESHLTISSVQPPSV
jgi:hypothetical protein